MPVGAVTDALLQLVHRQQVVLPLVVDHVQHHHALGVPHGVGAHQRFLLLVFLLQLVGNRVGDLVLGHAAQFRQVDLGAEQAQHVVAQRAQVPGVGVLVIGAAHVHALFHDAPRHVQDVLFLIRALQQLAAHAVHGLPLLVVDVVVLEQVFARFEVLHLDRFLGLGDAPGNQLRFDRHVLFHAQPQHQVLHPLPAEDAQQVVLQREEKLGAAGIALPAGAPAKLVVDAPRFVPLGAHDVQAAQTHHHVVFRVRLRLEPRKQLVPLVAPHPVELVVVREVIEMFVGDILRLVFRQPLRQLFLQAGVLGHKFRVAAQQDVGAAAGHVGRNRHHALAPGLRHNRRFPLVVLRVQHLVPHAHPLQDAGKPLRFLH